MRNEAASLMVRSTANREAEKWRANTSKSEGDNKNIQGDLSDTISSSILS